MAQGMTQSAGLPGWGRRVLWAAALVSLLGAARPVPSLFGVPLATATRATLRRALTAAHLSLASGGAHQWYDLYDVNGALKHASKLAVSYTQGGRFAKAEYVFPSFVSTKRLGEVIAEVRAKYGPPTRMSGRLAIGPARARWNLPQDFDIVVRRRWPNPTTFMIIENRRMFERMKAEQRRATAQSGAF